jgi:hypothetical protein
MFNFVKCLLSEYRILFMNMALDAPSITSTKSNLCLFNNVRMLLGLHPILPLLDAVHFLIKFG